MLEVDDLPVPPSAISRRINSRVVAAPVGICQPVGQIEVVL